MAERLSPEEVPARPSIRIGWWLRLGVPAKRGALLVMDVFPGARLVGWWKYYKPRRQRIGARAAVIAPPAWDGPDDD